MSKRFEKIRQKLDMERRYAVEEALNALVESATAKFDESFDAAFNLGVDPKQSDQQVRGAVTLPHGVGKKIRVAVFARGDKAKEAEAAGADFVGADDLVQKITEGWFEFDRVIATPDMMGQVGKVGKLLGPKGLMPNPKLGTVTFEVGKAIADQKKGSIEYRTEKAGVVHCSFGRKSMGAEKLKDNFMALYSAILKAKPATSKGTYLKKISLTTTMGPSLVLDASKIKVEG